MECLEFPLPPEFCNLDYVLHVKGSYVRLVFRDDGTGL